MEDRKVAVVTGGSKGIGEAIVSEFVKHGYIVYDLSRHVQEREKVNGVRIDICDLQEVKQVMQKIYKDNGRLDILVNNAGIMENGLLGMISHDSIVNQFQINVIAMIELTQLAARFMKKQKKGNIVNVSSIVGVRGSSGQSVYSATKGAVISFTKSAARELVNDGIRVNAVAPGMIGTSLLKDIKDDKLQGMISDIGMKRLGTPEEVAKVVDFLISDSASYITGQVVEIDGCSGF